MKTHTEVLREELQKLIDAGAKPTAATIALANQFDLIWNGTRFVDMLETSACKLNNWCVLQVGHAGDCKPRF